ncbi:MAG: hypothetical protein C0498_09095 [Anaerolinea sp.]|nr:hypothetical protein [Anaerolinea sp.]
MGLKLDPRYPAQQPFGSHRPSNAWFLGSAPDDDGASARPDSPVRTDWADCECPGDCLRDHENE